jgi:hypothetical protein
MSLCTRPKSFPLFVPVHFTIFSNCQKCTTHVDQ